MNEQSVCIRETGITISTRVDGVFLKGIIMSLSPRGIAVRIEEPYQGHSKPLYINYLGCARPAEMHYADNDGNLIEYGRRAAFRILEELYGCCNWYEKHCESLRSRYGRHLERLATLDRLGMPDERRQLLHWRARARLRAGKITAREYQRELKGFRVGNRIHGQAESIIENAFLEESGIPSCYQHRLDILEHFLSKAADGGSAGPDSNGGV